MTTSIGPAPISTSEVAAWCADLPRPGGGDTWSRWKHLIEVGRHDLSLAKLVEPHHDAAAILDDLGGAAVRGDEVWAVWAAEPPFAVLRARRADDGWRLSGRKAFCSGADLVTHALVTAETEDGSELFVVRLDASGIEVDSDAPPWTGPGMRRAATVTLRWADVRADHVAGPGAYTGRPGFWWGAIGVAACWLGGTLAVADLLERDGSTLGPHALAHRGAVRAGTDTALLALQAAADQVDRRPGTTASQRLALAVRAAVHDLAVDVVDRVGRATGPGPLAVHELHARRVNDLMVFVRQHHAESDLEVLGRLA